MHPEVFSIGGFTLSSWSLCVIIGVAILIVFYLRDLRKLGVEEKTIDRIIIIGSIGGIFVYIGASFFDSLWHAIDIAYQTGHFSLLDSSGQLVGGVTFEGGIVLGFIVWFILFPLGMKKDKRHSIYYLDHLVPYIFIAHSIGRIGCFLAGCCYGKPTTSFLGMIYPTDLYGTIRVYPTQLFEALGLLVFFIIFKLFVKKNKTEKYLITYGIFRFFLEYLRGDSRGMVFGGVISPSQFMSIIFILGGIACIIVRHFIYHGKRTELTDLKEKHGDVIESEEFRKQIDDSILKPLHDKKADKEAKKLGLSPEEINERHLHIDEVVNLNDERITPMVIKYYLDEEKVSKKREVLRYFGLGEIIIIVILLITIIINTTEGKSDRKVSNEAINATEEYLKSTDELDLVNTCYYIYVKKTNEEDMVNKVYISLKSGYTREYLLYDLDSKEVNISSETDYNKAHDKLSDSKSRVLYGEKKY